MYKFSRKFFMFLVLGLLLAGLVCASIALANTTNSFITNDNTNDDNDKRFTHTEADLKYKEANKGYTWKAALDVVEISSEKYYMVSQDCAKDGDYYPVAIALYDGSGNFYKELTRVKETYQTYPSFVKLSPTLDDNKKYVYFGVTTDNNTRDKIYRFLWDGNGTPQTAELVAKTDLNSDPKIYDAHGNFEMEWANVDHDKDSGTPRKWMPFLSELGTYPYDANNPAHNAIWLFDETKPDGQKLDEIVDLGSFSDRFAFDNGGNLYGGPYEDNTGKLYKWTLAQVESAIGTSKLTTGDGRHIADLAKGLSDVEVKNAEGSTPLRVYVTVNEKLGTQTAPLVEGRVYRYTPTDSGLYTEHYVGHNHGTDNERYLGSLAFDAGKIYVNVDHQKEFTPSAVVCISPRAQ